MTCPQKIHLDLTDQAQALLYLPINGLTADLSIGQLILSAPSGIWGHTFLEDLTMEFRYILAPTDFSEYSKQAVEVAAGLAQKFGAKLMLLHVVELPAYPTEGLVPSRVGVTLLEDLEQQARQELEKIVPAPGGGKIEVIRRVVVGIPYHKIVEVAAAEKVDLIVMATHGRTGISHLLMGSVAERVVRAAPCPVLTLRVSAARA
jgi:universal stress protein A